MAVNKLIPAPKTGDDFLSSSHYAIGFDQREVPDSMQVRSWGREVVMNDNCMRDDNILTSWNDRMID